MYKNPKKQNGNNYEKKTKIDNTFYVHEWIRKSLTFVKKKSKTKPSIDLIYLGPYESYCSHNYQKSFGASSHLYESSSSSSLEEISSTKQNTIFKCENKSISSSNDTIYKNKSLTSSNRTIYKTESAYYFEKFCSDTEYELENRPLEQTNKLTKSSPNLTEFIFPDIQKKVSFVDVPKKLSCVDENFLSKLNSLLSKRLSPASDLNKKSTSQTNVSNYNELISCDSKFSDYKSTKLTESDDFKDLIEFSDSEELIDSKQCDSDDFKKFEYDSKTDYLTCSSKISLIQIENSVDNTSSNFFTCSTIHTCLNNKQNESSDNFQCDELYSDKSYLSDMSEMNSWEYDSTNNTFVKQYDRNNKSCADEIIEISSNFDGNNKIDDDDQFGTNSIIEISSEFDETHADVNDKVEMLTNDRIEEFVQLDKNDIENLSFKSNKANLGSDQHSFGISTISSEISKFNLNNLSFKNENLNHETSNFRIDKANSVGDCLIVENEKINNVADDVDLNVETLNKIINEHKSENIESISLKQRSSSLNDLTQNSFETCEKNPNLHSTDDDFYESCVEEFQYLDYSENIALVEKRLKPKNKLKNLNCTKTTCSSSSDDVSLPKNLDYDTDTLRVDLTQLGYKPGPITKTTKRVYLKQLYKIAIGGNQKHQNDDKDKRVYSLELEKTFRNNEWYKQNLTKFKNLEQQMTEQGMKKIDKKLPDKFGKSCFTYLLLDPRITDNLPQKFDDNCDIQQIWKTFLLSIFYVGKGKRSRPYAHLYQAVKLWNDGQRKSQNKKINHILEIWKESRGVVCLHVFQNLEPTEAFTREACMIDVLDIKNLTNIQRGKYYGASSAWTLRERKEFGVYLLYKAMMIYLNEGERQLRPADID